MARVPRHIESTQPPEMSVAEWLARAPKPLAAQAAELREKEGKKLLGERETLMMRLRDIDDQLRALGYKSSAPRFALVTDRAEEPSPEWSVWQLVKHYLRQHPGSQAAEVCAFVLSIRPGDDEPRAMEANVLSVLYKNSLPGKALAKTGSRGSFRYSLREEAGD